MRGWRKSLARCFTLLVCVLVPFLPAEPHKSTPSAKSTATAPYALDDTHPGPAWFVDVSKQAGLDMENVNGGVNNKQYIIETTGSGVAILDYDTTAGQTYSW